MKRNLYFSELLELFWYFFLGLPAWGLVLVAPDDFELDLAVEFPLVHDFDDFFAFSLAETKKISEIAFTRLF